MKKLHYSDTIIPGLSFEAERFLNPDTCFYPVFSWVWNDVLDKNEIIKQIDEMREGGIRCFYIIPEPKEFRPNSMVTRLEPDYLSDEFMEFIKFAADYAAENDMYMWLYDEGGWPSGSACGKVVEENPNAVRKRLSKREILFKKGESYVISQDVKASFIENKRLFGGEIFDSDVKITEFFIAKDKILSGTTNRADNSERFSVETFIKTTHEKYKQFVGKYFGNVIPFMFTDEPQLEAFTFNSDFEDRFKAKYDYDILDILPILFKSYGENDDENRIRSDYFTLCGEIFNENFLKTQADWCKNNGLFFTGHLDVDHKCESAVGKGYTTHTDSLSKMDVPGIDAIWRQIYCGENTNDGMNFFPRIAMSAANRNGKNLTVSESFGVYGSGLTFNDMRYVLNHQFLRGINIMNFMNLSYGKTNFLTFAERPSLDRDKPGYNSMTKLNEYTARMSYLTTIGRSGADSLIYLPIKDIQAGGLISENAVKSFHDLGDKLENSGVDFHFCDDFSLKNAKIENHSIRIGEASYKNIYIPQNKYIPKEIKSKIQPFIGKFEPICKSSIGFDAIKVSKRTLDNGDELFFVFNESGSEKSAELSFDCKKMIYELDTLNGQIYWLSGNNSTTITIESGDIKCLLLSNERLNGDIPPQNLSFDTEKQLTNFEISKKSAFVITKEKGTKEFYPENYISAPLGSWKELLGEDFSGDVIYRTTLELNFEPKGKAMIDLGKVSYSAEVNINGRSCGHAIFEPMRLVIDAANFTKGSNVIEITVSNTAANQFVLSEVDKLFEPKEIGPYHERSVEFEIERLDGGLYGPVTVKFSK